MLLTADSIRKNKMNGYLAFYKDKQIEVRALSSYQAQQVAVALFKPRKPHAVSVMLCEKPGEQVTHAPLF